MKWSKNGQDLFKFSNKTVLLIPETVIEDEGRYSCIVETSLDEVEQEWNIEIVRSALITQFESAKISLIGSSVELPCVAIGIPKPKINWYFNDKKVVDN